MERHKVRIEDNGAYLEIEVNGEEIMHREYPSDISFEVLDAILRALAVDFKYEIVTCVAARRDD